MSENITANELSSKRITSEEVEVNGQDINKYIEERVKTLELDPVFKTWLSSESRLSDIGKNEISDYAKKSDIPTDYTTSSEVSTIIEGYNFQPSGDYALKTDLSTSDEISADLISKGAKFTDTTYTADSFKDNFLSTNISLSNINYNEISNYVKKELIKKALSDIINIDSYENTNISVFIKSIYNLA